MNKKNLQCIVLSRVFIALAILMTACLVSPTDISLGQSAKGLGVPVVLEKVVKRSVNPSVTLIGTAEPFRESVVSTGVEGLVKDFPVREGDRLDKGDILAQIDKQPLLLELKIARATLAQAKEKQLNALSELERVTGLYKKNSISSRRYDEAFYTAGALEKEILALEGRIEAIEYDVGMSTVTAPFSGIVVKEFTQVGQWLREGDKVVAIVEIDPILVTVPVPDRYIHYLEKGGRAELDFEVLPEGNKRQGVIREVIPVGNEKSRTFPVQVKVDNGNLSIFGGMSCKVSFSLAKGQEAVLVHKDAVITSGDKHHVFIVRNDKAVLVPVVKGRSYESLVVVKGELEAGESVVVEGNERIRPGQLVRAVAAKGKGS